MGALKLSYYEQEALNENCKIFGLGIEKTASGSVFCKDYYAFGMDIPDRNRPLLFVGTVIKNKNYEKSINNF